MTLDVHALIHVRPQISTLLCRDVLTRVNIYNMCSQLSRNPVSVNSYTITEEPRMKRYPGLAVAVALSILAGCGGAPGDTTDTSEWHAHWKCDGLSLYQFDGILGSFGKVVSNGIEERTDFKIDGLERRWNWGCNNPDRDYACEYSVILKKRTASYFHFLPGGEHPTASA